MSASCRIIEITLRSPNLNFLYIDKGIILILDPESIKILILCEFPIERDKVKTP